LTDAVVGSMLAPLAGVEPIRPSSAATETRLTLNAAAKRDVSSATTRTEKLCNSSHNTP